MGVGIFFCRTFKIIAANIGREKKDFKVLRVLNFITRTTTNVIFSGGAIFATCERNLIAKNPVWVSFFIGCLVLIILIIATISETKRVSQVVILANFCEPTT